MRRQILPRQRVARFGNHVDVRQAGLLRFPARFRLVFTVCFVSPFAFPRRRGIGRTALRFSRRVGDVSSSSSSSSPLLPRPLASGPSGRRYERLVDILATSDTSLTKTRLSQYPPVLCHHSVLPLPSFLRCFLPSCRLRYKECLFTTSLFVEPSFFTMPVALNRINLRARFKKILSHNSVMRTRPWLISYLWFIGWKIEDVQYIPSIILVPLRKKYI